MGFFDNLFDNKKVAGRPSQTENEIAEKVASATRSAIRSQGLAGLAVDEFIGKEIAKFTSDSSRTVFRKVKSML